MKWRITIGRFSLTNASSKNGGIAIEARYWEWTGNRTIHHTAETFRQALDWILTMKKVLAEREAQSVNRLRIGSID